MSTLLRILILFASMVVCGALSSYVANKKGYPAGVWFAIGFFTSVLGLIAAAGLPTQSSPANRQTRDDDYNSWKM